MIRMIAYRAETGMMPAVAEAQGVRRRPRRPLAELFRSEAAIVPELENGILRGRILGTAATPQGCATNSTGPARSSPEPDCAWSTNCRRSHRTPGKGITFIVENRLRGQDV